MDHKSAEGGLPPLDSSYSSAASALFSGGESRSRSLSSVGGREGFEAVQANRAGVRGRESGAGRKENEGSSSRRRSRIPHLVHGKKTEVRSRRGRSVTLSLLLLSLLSLVLRRLLVKCGYLFSKPRNAGSVETFTEGHVHRRLASGGGEDEVTPPSSSPLPASLAACTEEHQAELLNISPARPEGTPEAEELSKGQKALTTEGVEVPGGGRKRKTPRGPDGNAQTGVPPAKQTRGDRVLEVLAAHPHIAAVLMEPLTPPDTSSRKTSDGEARQDAELSTASRMMSQALVVEEFPDSGEEEEPGGPLRRFPERRKPLANDIRGLSSDGYVSIEDAAKQTRRDSLELLAAQALTLLMDSPSPPHTSSRTTSEDEAGEEGPFSTPPRATSQAPVAEGFSESKQEPEGLLVRLLTKGRKFSADNVPGPLRDGHARIEGEPEEGTSVGVRVC
ncbi:hypothetical protein CSUI_003610 [Cystoisospora suis]|uniref:Uncharacterized protein n=1 Tax=Cystoisospora suis TaxID=483139 RepID=A0A2C6L4A4_9APIC|nr:hypothetical protein CSUI_003610 [Cystoisospora suis]